MTTQTRRQRNVQTHDREATDIYALDRIGPQRRKTPEGYLLCENVPIARTGWLMYGPGQTPVSTNDAGVTYIVRDASVLFDPNTLASFQGKPVTLGHPPVNVSPADAKLYSVGTTLNPRQGEGPMHDCIVADLLIMDQRAIDSVEAAFSGDPRGLREVSAGYNADYEEIARGEGRQLNILGNHVALVPQGRCGPRCAVNDHSTTFSKEPAMAKPRVSVMHKNPTPPRRVRLAAVRDGLEAAMSALGIDGTADPVGGDMVYGDDDHQEPDGDEAGGIHVHVHLDGGGAAPAAPAAPAADTDPAVDPATGEPLDPTAGTDPTDPTAAPAAGGNLETRVAGMETALASLTAMVKKALGVSDEPPTKDEETDPVPPKADEEDGKKPPTQDSAALQTGFQRLAADAEVLVPGFRMPTFDAAATRAATIDSMCATRRRVLDQCMTSPDGRALVTGLFAVVDAEPSADIATMDCAAVGTLFAAASAQRRAVNNARAQAGSHTLPTKDAGLQKPKPPRTPAEINKANADFWSKRQAALNS